MNRIMNVIIGWIGLWMWWWHQISEAASPLSRLWGPTYTHGDTMHIEGNTNSVTIKKQLQTQIQMKIQIRNCRDCEGLLIPTVTQCTLKETQIQLQ